MEYLVNNWEGYLFKAVETNKKFPMQYIEVSTWDSVPNQREEIKAYRDDNTRNLHRKTASGHKTSLAFSLRAGLHLNDKIEIQKFFTDAESNATERKIQLRYWNDESNEYKTGYFYRPDLHFKIRTLTEYDIIYESIDIELIEY